MILATYIVFFLGTALLAGAAVLAIIYLRGANHQPVLGLAGRAAMGAAVCFGVTIALRVAAWRLVPLTTGTDSLNLFLFIGTATGLLVSHQERRRGLRAFLFPPLGVIALLAAALAAPDLGQRPADLSATLLIVHVVSAILAYALFFVACITSVAYAVQAYRLKHRSATRAFHKLPSLENLDRVLYQLILAGYPFVVLTLVLGFSWAWYQRELLGPIWWFSPKIILSLCMAVLYAISFHARSLGLLRGPKLAYLVFIGVAALLGVYFLLEALELTNYNFWGPAP